MGLRNQAFLDCQSILENTDHFGWPITLTNPTGTSKSLVGSSGDIGLLIDPETGQAVTGRFAHIALSLKSLTDAGLGIPEGIAGEAGKPWLVQFTDPSLNAYTFKVSSSAPDRMLGLVTCTLEVYQ